MKLSRREFLEWLSYTGISLLGSDRILKAEESQIEGGSKLIVPTLEEITEMLSKTPQEVLEPAIRGGLINEFKYTRQTKPEDLYESLNKRFNDPLIFALAETNIDTVKKNKWFKMTSLSAGAAIVFFYSAKNLQNSNVACMVLEFADFYGEQQWDRVKLTFQNKLEGFPCFMEFVMKEGAGYTFTDITGTSLKDPENILKYIPLYVDDFRKRTSK